MNKELYETVIADIEVQFGAGDCIEPGDREACAEMIVESLEKAGYRKVGEVHEPKTDYKPERDGYNSWGHKECAVCGYSLASKFGCTEQEARELSTDNYCPNCGARLKEVDE